MKVITILLLVFLLLGCSRQVPPVSNFKVEEIAYARAAIFEADIFYVLDSIGNYAPGVLDSVELNGEDARSAVTALLSGLNYAMPVVEEDTGYLIYDGVLCHTPHFLLQAYDSEGHQTNLFTVCFTCGNVRMTNHWKYPKFDELMMSPTGEAELSALQDDLFPAYEGTFFWDPFRSIRLKE